MGTRHLYLARHGEADAFGRPTPAGERQSALLGERLAGVPVDAVWHSPLPRAAAGAHRVAERLARPVPVAEAAELIDHVPHVPDAAEMPAAWAGFFDGYDEAEAASGRRTAQALTDRFAAPLERSAPDLHEVLITHDYPIAWLLRDAMSAPPVRWLGLHSANAALTVIEYRPGTAPAVVMVNDTGHLPAELRWTGFPSAVRP